MKKTIVRIQRTVSPDGNARAESWAIATSNTESDDGSIQEVSQELEVTATSNHASSYSSSHSQSTATRSN